MLVFPSIMYYLIKNCRFTQDIVLRIVQMKPVFFYFKCNFSNEIEILTTLAVTAPLFSVDQRICSCFRVQH
jgi:hypothetical protein